jgi:Tol biopolymer transport system component
LSLILLCVIACQQEKVTYEKYSTSNKDRPFGFGGPRFLSDNDQIMFTYLMNGVKAMAIYEISNNRVYRFTKYDRLLGKFIYPIYSRDGNKVTFADSDDPKYEMNIYVMNADGSGLRQLTHSDKPVKDWKGDLIIKYSTQPSFSPDGKKIIFQRSGVKHKRAFPLTGEIFTHWDVYELDLRTGKERRLTNYSFYEMSKPSYLSDGKRFVFSGTGPSEDSGVDTDSEEYRKLYRANKIFIMDGVNNVFEPAFTNGRNSDEPDVSWDDTILFVSRTNEMDGIPWKSKSETPVNYDLFVYQRGNISRLTKMQSAIFQASISPDGKKAVFLARKHDEKKGYSMWVVNTDGTVLMKLNIPWEQLEEQTSSAEKPK